MRPSLALGEAVLAFTEARKTVLDFATNIPQESGATLKRNTDELSGSSQITEEAPERKRVRTSARLAAAERSRPVSYVEVAEQPKGA